MTLCDAPHWRKLDISRLYGGGQRDVIYSAADSSQGNRVLTTERVAYNIDQTNFRIVIDDASLIYTFFFV